MLAHASLGAKLSPEEERSGLDWLLGDPAPTVHDLTVQYETPKGLVPLTFVLKQLDTRVIDEIEQKHVNRATGSLDRLTADVEIVAAATVHVVDAQGDEVKLESDRFRTVRQPMPGGEVKSVVLASPLMALERRFAKQLGLLGNVAMEIRKIAGLDPQRVGTAQRRLVSASLD